MFDVIGIGNRHKGITPIGMIWITNKDLRDVAKSEEEKIEVAADCALDVSALSVSYYHSITSVVHHGICPILHDDDAADNGNRRRRGNIKCRHRR